MATVIGKEGEPFEKLLRRFKKKVETSGILKEVRKNEYYMKPSVAKKIKWAAAKKKRQRSAARKSRS